MDGNLGRRGLRGTPFDGPFQSGTGDRAVNDEWMTAIAGNGRTLGRVAESIQMQAVGRRTTTAIIVTKASGMFSDDEYDSAESERGEPGALGGGLLASFIQDPILTR